MSNAVVHVNGSHSVFPTVLGRGPARIPTGGKIRAGIKVLSRRAAEFPEARAIYDRGLAAGDSFVQIEKALAEALPRLKAPLVPKNVPWFTVRGQDFPHPEMAQQILDTYGEVREDGVKRLYRFPVVFPSDFWQVVMPHELAAWGASEKHYWSDYSPDGRVRYCKRHATAPFDDTGKRVIRIFGGRKAVTREQNGGFVRPGIVPTVPASPVQPDRSLSVLHPGNSLHQCLRAGDEQLLRHEHGHPEVRNHQFPAWRAYLGFLDSRGTPFYLTKKLTEVARIDAQGRSARVAQWIIDLQAEVDVTSLLRDSEDEEAAIVQARHAIQVLEGSGLAQAVVDPQPAGTATAAGIDATLDAPYAESSISAPIESSEADVAALSGESSRRSVEPTLDRVRQKIQSYGIGLSQFDLYADKRWGRGWRLNVGGRRRAFEELERYRNDPQGYLDKIDCALRGRE
jgi:hypothetical protein